MSFKAVLEADIKGFSNNIDKAVSDVDRLEKTTLQKLSKVGDSFISIGKKASILSVALVGVGGKAFSMAADFEDALGATQQIFKDNSDTVQDWANNLDTSYGIAKKEALSYSNLMGSMLINIGNLTEKEASKQSAKLIELAGDLTAMYGGTTQDAVRALTGALKGNNTMLDNYGMAVNEALIKQKALELGLISGTSEMTLQAKQAATLALIWEQTGAAQGQAAREADGASGAMRAFRTEVSNLSTELGEVLLPIITPIISKFSDFVSGLRALSPEMQSIIVGVAGVTAVAGPLLIVIGNILKALPLIKAALVALTGPVGLVVAAVAGATALIISNWDSIKEYFTTGGGSELFDSIKNLFSAAKEYISIVFSQIKTVITTIWNAIGDTLIKVFGNSFDTIMTVVTTAIDIVSGVLNTFINLLKGDFSGALESVKTLATNVFSGISRIVLNAVSSISSALAGLFNLIGMDKWASGLRSFSEKLTPSMQSAAESTEETTAAIEDQSAAVDALNNSLGDTAEIAELDTFQKLIGEQLNVRDAITKTTATIEELQSKLVKLQTGILPSTNVRQELAETQQQINDLSTALDLLTGGRELSIDVKTNVSGIENVLDNKFLKDGKFALPPIDTSALDASMGDLSQKAQAIKVTVGDVLGNLFADASTAIMEGDNVMTALASSMLGMLGGIMVDLGKMALGIGIGLEAIQKALMSLNPVLAIGAGVALIALGSLFSAGSRKLASSMGSGGGAGYSSAPSLRNTGPGYAPSEYRGQYQDDFKVEFKIGTNELVGVLNTAEQRRNRL
jgi:hypothetical protein